MRFGETAQINTYRLLFLLPTHFAQIVILIVAQKLPNRYFHPSLLTEIGCKVDGLCCTESITSLASSYSEGGYFEWSFAMNV